jgi:hypothetical protein
LDAPDVPNAYRKTNARGGGNNREGNKKTNHRDLPLALSAAAGTGSSRAAPNEHAIKDKKGQPESRRSLLGIDVSAANSESFNRCRVVSHLVDDSTTG